MQEVEVRVAVDRCAEVKGSARFGNAERDRSSPHYRIVPSGGIANLRMPVNVRSVLTPPDVLYLLDDDFRHPVTADLPPLPDGFKPIPSAPGGIALDYIRGSLFDRTKMRPLAHDIDGETDLNDLIDLHVKRAIAEPAARLYAFGSRWGPQQGTDRKIPEFPITPDDGVHDIHMNQGNSQPRFMAENGVYQDGALLIHSPVAGRWTAFFFAFQSQVWHTDDRAGCPAPNPGPGEPDLIVRIAAVLVNPTGAAPERETATLLNTTPAPIDLNGRTLVTKSMQATALSGTLKAGEAKAFAVEPRAPLGNYGGTIALINGDDLKEAHGVTYTKAQAVREGWTIVF